MIETTIPEIDVAELMARVQIEAAKTDFFGLPDQLPSLVSKAGPALASEPLPPVPLLRPPPALTLGRPVDAKKERLQAMLAAARDKITVSSRVPKFLRWVFRKQGGFDRSLLDAVAILAKNNAALNERVRELSAALESHHRWAAAAPAHGQAQAAWMAAVARRFNGYEYRLGLLRDKLESAQPVEGKELHPNRFASPPVVTIPSEGQPTDSTQTKRESSSLSLPPPAEAQPKLHPEEPVVTRSDASPDERARELDAFYLAFENRFRGPRADIKSRLRFYLPLLQAAGAGDAERPVLDVGCGRGEWLELLSDSNLAAGGVDFNSAMVAENKERGLAVERADALQYLRSLPENSQGGVTGFHIIEHLPFEVLMDFLGETNRVLKPGGVAIFESPNCKNIVVGASNFHSDPTHRAPVFPDTAAFLLERQGFERIQIEYISPVEASAIHASDSEVSKLHNWFYGPRDFAVIGHKARS